jgi:acyl-CoA reductase-like NAD-dependent aldehyde dehydrogenase
VLSIGGRHSEALDGRTFERRNPVTGEVATVAAASGIADAVAAVETPAAAFPATRPALKTDVPEPFRAQIRE